MTLNTTVAAKSSTSGTIAESNIAKNLFDLSEEAVMISLEVSSMTRSTAMRKPPIPPLMTVVIVTALDDALEVAAAIIANIIICIVNVRYIRLFHVINFDNHGMLAHMIVGTSRRAEHSWDRPTL